MSLKDKNLTVFDVCNTITKVNNTSYFISFVLKKNLIKFFSFNCFLFFSKIILNIFNKNVPVNILLRRLQIMFLKGYGIKYLDRKAKAYVNYLKSKNLFNKDILKIIKKAQAEKNHVVLISASINPPIENIAKSLGVNSYFSSQLEYKRGICTGKLKIDLFRNKQKIIFKKLIDFKKYKKSSIYSDNLEDVKFINHFNSVNIILKNKNEERLWKVNKKKIKFISINNNYPINKSNKNLIYIPSFYYFISRFKLKGTIEDFLLKQLLPYTVILSLSSGFSFLKSLFLNLAILILFYSIYEIGGLFNDLNSCREKEGNPTKRLSPNIKLNILFFLIIRFFFSLLFGLLLYLKFYSNLSYFVSFYILLILTLAIYLTHSLLKVKIRVLSFTILKIFRNFIPLLILYYFLPKNLFFFIFILFLLLDAPFRIYHYLKKQGLTKKIFLFEKKGALIIFLLLVCLLYETDKKLYLVPLYFLFLNLLKSIYGKLKTLIDSSKYYNIIKFFFLKVFI